MYWKQEPEGIQLVKTLPNKRQERLGRRTTDTEKIYETYISKKKEIEGRLAVLTSCARLIGRLSAKKGHLKQR